MSIKPATAIPGPRTIATNTQCRHRGRLAAGIRVAKKDVEKYWLEVYVDESDDAVIELSSNDARERKGTTLCNLCSTVSYPLEAEIDA